MSRWLSSARWNPNPRPFSNTSAMWC
jgi:hypothetical protein